MAYRAGVVGVRALLLGLLVSLASSAFAAVPTVVKWAWFDDGWSGSYSFASGAAACTADVAAKNVGSYTTAFTSYTALSDIAGQCRYNFTRISDQWTTARVADMRGSAVCPTNSTLTGGSCICNSGFPENAAHTACEAPCPAGQTASATIGLGWFPDGGSVLPQIAAAARTICVQNGANLCSANVTYQMGMGGAVVNGQRPVTAQVAGPLTGATCAGPVTPAVVTDPVPPCPAGSLQGFVNGVSTCSGQQDSAQKIALAAEAATTAARDAAALAAYAADAAGLSSTAIAAAAAAAGSAAGAAAANASKAGATAAAAAAAGAAAGASAGATAGAAAQAAITSGSTPAAAATAGATAGASPVAASAGASTAANVAGTAAAVSVGLSADAAAAVGTAAAVAAANSMAASQAAGATAAAAAAAAQAAGSAAADRVATAALNAKNAALLSGANAAAAALAAKNAADLAAAEKATRDVSAAAAAAAAAAKNAKSDAPGDPVGDFCKANPEASMCVKNRELGEAGAADTLANSSVTLSIAADSGWGPSSAACPAPRTFVVMGKTLSMPFTILCEFASNIRPLVLALAWLGAAALLIGAGRRS